MGVAATTAWTLAVAWRLGRGRDPLLECGGARRIWCLVLTADVISIAGALSADPLRNITVGTLVLPRIDVVVLIVEHGLLAALVVQALRQGPPGQALVALLTLALGVRAASLPLSFAVTLAAWCYLDARREAGAPTLRPAVALYGAIGLGFVALWLWARLRGPLPPEPNPRLVLTWAEMS